MAHKVLFRADAEKSIGAGDLMSLVHLADTFRRHSWETFFMARDYPEAIKIISGRGMTNVRMIPRSASLELEMGMIWEECSKRDITCLFMEITGRTLDEYSLLGKPSKVKACVNFDGVVTPDFDLIVNWNAEPDTNPYEQGATGRASFILGFEKTVLPDSLIRENPPQRKYDPDPRRVLVSMGGIDEFNLTEKIIRALRDIGAGYEVRVIAGPGYRDSATLGAAGSFTVKYNVADMRQEYLWADIAFSAGGLTCSELVAAKTPAILIASYPHQVERCRYYDQKGWAYYAGFREELQQRDIAVHLRKALEKIGAIRERLSALTFKGGNEEIFKAIECRIS